MTYHSDKNALLMLRFFAQGDADIRKGPVESQNQVFEDLKPDC